MQTRSLSEPTSKWMGNSMLRLGSRVWHRVTEQRDVFGGEMHHFNGLQPTDSWHLRTKHR